MNPFNREKKSDNHSWLSHRIVIKTNETMSKFISSESIKCLPNMKHYFIVQAEK